MKLLPLMFKKIGVLYELKRGEKITIFFTVYLKLLANSDDQINSLMSVVRIFSDYIKVEFDVDESRKSRSKTKDRSARW